MNLSRMSRSVTLGAGVVALLTMLGGGVAQARDLTGRWGLGISTAFGPRGMAGPSASTGTGAQPLGLGLPGLAAQYHVNENLTINPGLAVGYRTASGVNGGDADTVTDYTVGARVLYNLAHEANASFYIGGGLILTLRGASDDASTYPGRQIRLPLVFGTELFFSKAGSFAVHCEGGLEVSQFTPADTEVNPTVMSINTVGGVFNLGFTWYFSGPGEAAGE